MKALSGFSKCTICLNEEKLTFEHIIPESIGGFLEADLQCAKCNSELGNNLIFKAKQTYTIRLAIRYLRNELSKLFRSIEEGQEYSVRRSDETSATALFKNGMVMTKAGREKDGSIVIDQKDTDCNLKNRLKKEGLTAEEIKSKLDEFNKLPIDQHLQITKTLNVIKRKFVSVFPQGNDVDMDKRIITLIAYNYLCITIGQTIFERYFDSIRDYILKDIQTNRILIEQYPYNGTYKSYHKIYRETLEDRTKITITLFGSIVYRISFLQLKIMISNNDVIIQELKNKNLYYAQTIEEAKKGNYKIV